MISFEALGPFGPGGVLAPAVILVLAALPIGEVRFSLPVALFVYGMGWGEAVVWSLIGNFGVVPGLFWLYPRIEKALMRTRPGAQALQWTLERTRKRHSKKVERYQELALFMFIAVPVPGTGAWMGALVAHLFGLSWRKSWRYVYSGVTAACFLVLAICLLAENVARRWFL